MDREQQQNQNIIESAVLEIQNGNIDESAKLLKKLLENDPTSEEAMFGLALCEYRNGNAILALNYLVELIKLNSDIVDAYYLAGTILMDTEDFESASLLFETAIEKDAGFRDAHRSYAYLMFRMNKSEKGLNILLELLKDDPEDYQALMMLGQYYHKLGNLDAARFYMTKVLLLNPDYLPAQDISAKISKG